jgi:hypothetical protein
MRPQRLGEFDRPGSMLQSFAGFPAKHREHRAVTESVRKLATRRTLLESSDRPFR